MDVFESKIARPEGYFIGTSTGRKSTSCLPPKNELPATKNVSRFKKKRAREVKKYSMGAGLRIQKKTKSFTFPVFPKKEKQLWDL